MTKKVLIIDDETDFCLIMKLYFSKKNYQVTVSHFLLSGLELMSTLNPDVLFLDNNLPDGNGWNELGNIVQKFPHIRVFLVSAHRQASSVTIQNANTTIWEKPISLTMLDKVF